MLDLLVIENRTEPLDFRFNAATGVGGQVVSQKPGKSLVIFDSFWGKADPAMAAKRVSYAVQVYGNWVRVFRERILMIEAEDLQRGNGTLFFDRLKVLGSLYEVRLRVR